MKEILPCLNIKLNKISNLHGWIYEEWLRDIEDDPHHEILMNVNNDKSVLQETIPIYILEHLVPVGPHPSLLFTIQESPFHLMKILISLLAELLELCFLVGS